LRNVSKNSSADIAARVGSKRRISTPSIPHSASVSSFCRRVSRRRGRRDGATTESGCGSNVTRSDWIPRRFAAAVALLRIARWPRCTPS
jgi:hypothetical protein